MIVLSRKSPLTRKTPLRSTRIRAKLPVKAALDRAQRDERDTWLVGMERRCAMCGGDCGRVEGHHVISKQRLRRLGLHLHLWDRRNRMPLGEGCHQAHTTRVRPVPRHLVPGSALEFAHELGLVYVLERDYPEAAA